MIVNFKKITVFALKKKTKIGTHKKLRFLAAPKSANKIRLFVHTRKWKLGVAENANRKISISPRAFPIPCS